MEERGAEPLHDTQVGDIQMTSAEDGKDDISSQFKFAVFSSNMIIFLISLHI